MWHTITRSIKGNLCGFRKGWVCGVTLKSLLEHEGKPTKELTRELAEIGYHRAVKMRFNGIRWTLYHKEGWRYTPSEGHEALLAFWHDQGLDISPGHGTIHVPHWQ